jgi:ADP-ribose pyrophosphatase YjhB (NUDIX family)
LIYPTDLTVAAVVERDNSFLLVEETAMGRRVISQPGGHIEAGESPERAVEREVLEETGCTVTCRDMIGVYLWIHPQTRQQLLRIVYAAEFVRRDASAEIDEGIFGHRWMTYDEIQANQAVLRTPAVLRCIDDYCAGRRASDALLTGMLPLEQNVQRILARANLV